MILIMAGLLSFSIALIWERLLLVISLPEKMRVGIIIPISEELIKLAVATLFQVAPIFVYVLFGLGEGILEAIHLKKHFKYLAIPVGIVTHLVFGSYFLLKISIIGQLGLAIITHICWNSLVISKYFKKPTVN